MSARARGPRLVVCGLLTLGLVLSRPTTIDSMFWWKSPRFIRTLGLTTEQSALVHRIYEDTLPERRQLADEADAAQARLQRLLDMDLRDEEVIEAAIAEASDADAARRGLRTKMLYRIWRVLSPDQRSQLEALAASQSPMARGM